MICVVVIMLLSPIILASVAWESLRKRKK